MAKKKDEKLEAVETEEVMAKFQEKLQELLALSKKRKICWNTRKSMNFSKI